MRTKLQYTWFLMCSATLGGAVGAILAAWPTN